MKYILIFWMISGYSSYSSPAITTATYNDRGACESAGVATQVAMKGLLSGFTCTRQAEQ